LVGNDDDEQGARNPPITRITHLTRFPEKKTALALDDDIAENGIVRQERLGHSHPLRSDAEKYKGNLFWHYFSVFELRRCFTLLRFFQTRYAPR